MHKAFNSHSLIRLSVGQKTKGVNNCVFVFCDNDLHCFYDDVWVDCPITIVHYDSMDGLNMILRTSPSYYQGPFLASLAKYLLALANGHSLYRGAREQTSLWLRWQYA